MRNCSVYLPEHILCKKKLGQNILVLMARHMPTLTLQRGVTSAARHSENITCHGVTSTARHAALSNSFDYISTTQGENVIRLLCTCS